MKKIVYNLLVGAASGMVTGGIVGAVEFIILGRSFYIPHTGLLPIMVSYSAYWCLGATILACLMSMRPRDRAEEWGVLALQYIALTLAGGIFVFLAYKINAYKLVHPLDPSSIISNGLLLVAAFLVIWVILRTLAKANPRHGFFVFIAAGLVWAVALFSSTMLFRKPQSEAKLPFPMSSYPNVLILLVDTLRADHLGCYGYGRPTSPSIDELAADSVKFTSCIAASSWTLPSTVSILTGLFPTSHGVEHYESSVPPGAIMIPDITGSFGFRTAYIATNPMVLRTNGFAQNVDYYQEGYKRSVTALTSLGYCLFQADRFYQEVIGGPGELSFIFRKVRIALENPEGNKQDAGWANEKFLSFLDQHSNSPFVAYIHYMEPHTPYEPRSAYDSMFTDPGYKGPDLNSHPRDENKIIMPPLTQGSELPEPQRHHLVDKYDGEIRSFDAYLDELLQALKRRRLYDNTLIVLTADHGEEFYEHKAWEHGHSLYQEVIHVPLIMKLPESRRAGTVIKSTCRHVDILPTILELVGLPPLPHVQGISLAPYIESEDDLPELPGNWALSEMYAHGAGDYASAYVEGTYKIMRISADKDHWFLYNLNDDPLELHSMAAQAGDLLNNMSTQMISRLSYYSQKKWESHSTKLSEEDMKQLRALGYMQK